MKVLLLAAVLAAAGPAPEARVIDLFYDLQFDKALAAAQELGRKHPGHPVGPFYESIVYYQRFLAEEPRNPETLRLFEKHHEQAVEAAERLLSSAPAEGHYYLGIARGFKGRVLAAQRRYLRAIPEALGAVKHLEQALALDPTLEDAYLGLGMYHYFTDRIPAGAKPFAFLIGAGWGDREKGLAYLQRAAEKGGPAKMEARSVLSSIYALEGRWTEAETYLRELSGRYPRNPLYRLRLAYVLGRQQKWDELLDLSWLAKVPPELRELAQHPAMYRKAEALLMLGRVEEAEALVAELEKRPSLGPALRDFTLLRRANLLDLYGRRDKAVEVYKRVKHKEARKLADRWLRSPYAGPEPDALMPWLGLETPS